MVQVCADPLSPSELLPQSPPPSLIETLTTDTASLAEGAASPLIDDDVQRYPSRDQVMGTTTMMADTTVMMADTTTMMADTAIRQSSSMAPLQSYGGRCCLSERINTATRSTHTQLNRMIIAGLPLALPPYTPDPSIYTFGIRHIAPIYITFESLWRRILDAPDGIDEERPLKSFRAGDKTKGCAGHPCSRIRSVLCDLRLPDLLRSQRLRADIRTLSRSSGGQDFDEQFDQIIHNSGTIANFVAHITESVNAKPHVLIAYTWILYMALFSGGRHLRAILQRAGPGFWMGGEGNGIPPSTSVEDHGLQFFHFAGEEQGEDIKREFKTRFATCETVLSDEEKEDIVQEAQRIFDFMLELVEELTQVCASDPGTVVHPESKRVMSPAVVVASGAVSAGRRTQPATRTTRKADLSLFGVYSPRAPRLIATVSVSFILLGLCCARYSSLWVLGNTSVNIWILRLLALISS